MSATPSLSGAIGGLFDYKAHQMFTSIPAIVVSVKDLGDKRIDVQPSLVMRTAEGSTGKSLPSILNVPVQMPCTSQGGLTMPVSVGDTVLLVFSQRGIDTWKRGSGGMATPSDLRTFDAQDAIAILGVHSFISSPNQPSKRSNSHSVEDVVLVHNIGGGNETEIRLLKGGGVVVNTSQNVVVNCEKSEVNASKMVINADLEVNGSTDLNGSLGVAGDSSLMGGADVAGGLGVDGVSFGTHRHSGVEGGSDVSGGPI